jgi:galactokinase
MAFDLAKSVKTNDDGTIDIPDNHIKTLRNALFVALSYRGCDNHELMSDPTCHLNTLKKAILKMNDCFNDGDLENGKQLKDSIKNALKKRATAVKRLSTTMIDFLSGEKYKFDNKMYTIMNKKKIIPKS